MIELKVKRFVDEEDLTIDYEVVRVKALRFKQLPKAYTRSGSGKSFWFHSYKDSQKKVVRMFKFRGFKYGELKVGEVLSESDYKAVVTFIHEAGDRLLEINNKIERLHRQVKEEGADIHLYI